MALNITDVWSITLAILTALGGGGVIVLALSSWLGKVWAERLLERQRASIQLEFAELKAKLDKSIYAHNVAASRIDSQRVEAIRHLYGALVTWHNAVLEIAAPNNLGNKPYQDAIAIYERWASILRKKSAALENIYMHTAIFFSEETDRLIAKCGMSASQMSIDFLGTIKNHPQLNTPAHLAAIELARTELQKNYEKAYTPARAAVITAFRRIVDPNAASLLEQQ